MNPTNPAARIGQVLDRYELGEVIGVGGFGTVYRARHTALNRVVALKVLHGRPDEEQRQRFVREAQATVAVEHPSIVQVFDFGTTSEGEMFLVMELLEGEELEARRMRSPLPPQEALKIMCDVLDALIVAHAAGVVHRDLKPANIFLTPQGVKLLDFGISLVRDDGQERMTRTGLVLGTPLYMAPESFSGVSEVDERVDVYAVAAVLYELLSGRAVFDVDSYEQLVVKVATERATPMAQVAPGAPAELAAIIDRGLASGPNERWPSAVAFRDALLPFAVAEAEPMRGAPGSAHAAAAGSALGVPKPATAHPPKRGIRPLTLGLSGLALLGVSVGALALMGTGEQTPPLEQTDGRTTSVQPASGVFMGAGTCEAPLALVLGVPFAGNTDGGASTLTASCGDEGAPENVHVLQIQTRTQVTIRVAAHFDSVLSMTLGCGPGVRELACNDDFNHEQNRSRISQLLEPGTYFLVVDGFDGESGPYTIVASGVVAHQGAACGADAPTLAPGDVHGSTEGLSNDFESSCVTPPSGPDVAYRLNITEPSRVRLRQMAQEDGALHLRSDCMSLESEIACNDDHEDPTVSVITAHLDAGSYWVISDGYDETDGGYYTINTEVFPDSRLTPLDGCAAPLAMTSAAARPDTFLAMNRLQGSCGGRGGPEQVFAFSLQAPSRVRVDVLESEFTGAYYVRSRCQDSTSEHFCGGFGDGVGVEDTQGAPIEHELPAGSYFLIVDGRTTNDFGVANVHLVRTPL